MDYLIQVANLFETLVLLTSSYNPDECVKQINDNIEIISQVFSLEDPENVPVEEMAAASTNVLRMQQFANTYMQIMQALVGANVAPKMPETNPVGPFGADKTKRVLH